MEAAPSVKPRRGSPPIPPNYVSLRQLQELRLKEEEEKQRQEAARKAEMEEKQRQEAAHKAEMEEKQRQEAARKAEMEEKQRKTAARKAEMEAMAAAAAIQDAARKPETKVRALGSVAPGGTKERRGAGPVAKWVAVADRPPPPPPLSRVEDMVRTEGVDRGNKGRADAPRAGGGGKPEGKPKGAGQEEVSASTSAQTRTDEPGTPADASSIGGRQGPKAPGGTSAEPDSIGRSGGSAGPSSRRRYKHKGKKDAGGRSAEPSPANVLAKTCGESPPQGVKPENAGNPESPEPKRAVASPISESSDGKKADARPAPPTSAGAGSVAELRTTAETKPEPLAEQKPRRCFSSISGHRALPRPPGDRRNVAREQHERVWVPKAASGCAEL